MNESDQIIINFVFLLVGVLMALGLVLLFTFFGSDDACRSAVYTLLDI